MWPVLGRPFRHRLCSSSKSARVRVDCQAVGVVQPIDTLLSATRDSVRALLLVGQAPSYHTALLALRHHTCIDPHQLARQSLYAPKSPKLIWVQRWFKQTTNEDLVLPLPARER